jgi:hypothetical protein
VEEAEEEDVPAAEGTDISDSPLFRGIDAAFDGNVAKAGIELERLERDTNDPDERLSRTALSRAATFCAKHDSDREQTA